MADNSLGNQVYSSLRSLGITSKRMIAFIIDIFLIGIVSGILGISFDVLSLPAVFSDNLIYVIISIFLFRDLMYRQGSFGKKIVNLQILNINHEPAGVGQRVLRNLTTLIWPVEAVVIIFNKKRIGDILFKTIVVDIEK